MDSRTSQRLIQHETLIVIPSARRNLILRSWYDRGMSLNDLEFAYAPVRTQVRDLREYL